MNRETLITEIEKSSAVDLLNLRSEILEHLRDTDTHKPSKKEKAPKEAT